MFAFMVLLAEAQGQAPPAGATPAPAGDPMLPIFIMIALFVPFYLLFMRPMQKQDRDRKAQLAALKKNDEVVTIGGVVGTVVQIKEKEVGGEDVIILRLLDDKTRMPVLRSGVARIVNPPEPGKTDAAKDKDTSGK